MAWINRSTEADIDYLQQTIEHPTEILPNLKKAGKGYRMRSVLFIRKNGSKNYISIVEMTPGAKRNVLWNFWKMNSGKAEKYLRKFREEKTRLLNLEGRSQPSYSSHQSENAQVGKPEDLSGSQVDQSGAYNIVGNNKKYNRDCE